MRSSILLFIAIFAISCGSARKGGGQAALSDTLYKARYAAKFEIFGSGDSLVLRVHNPWQGAANVFFDYQFAKNPERKPRVICMSSSHVAYLDAVGRVDDIVGVSGRDFIANPKIQADRTPDVGYDNNLNYELIVSLKPDYVFVYEVAGENSASTQKLRQLGIPVIYVADYLEQHPLARAEWVVAFGAMVGRMEEAEMLFREIATSYESTKDSVGRIGGIKPRVMLNSPYRDVWYVPGDRSYIVQLVEDAGGDYLAQGVDDDISRPISSETAFTLMSRADIWLHPSIGENTVEKIRNQHHRFACLPVVSRGDIYNNNARSTPQGGSDFWESGALRADLIIADLAKIFYPQHFPAHELYYYRRVE